VILPSLSVLQSLLSIDASKDAFMRANGAVELQHLAQTVTGSFCCHASLMQAFARKDQCNCGRKEPACMWLAMYGCVSAHALSSCKGSISRSFSVLNPVSDATHSSAIMHPIEHKHIECILWPQDPCDTPCAFLIDCFLNLSVEFVEVLTLQ